MLNLANNIRKQRKLSSKTQEDMAKILNVKRATYGEYERGNNLPPIDKLIVIADCFGVSIDYLVGRSEQQIIDVAQTIEHILKTLEHNRSCLRFNDNELSELTSKMIACSLEHVLNSTNIILKDELN